MTRGGLYLRKRRRSYPVRRDGHWSRSYRRRSTVPLHFKLIATDELWATTTSVRVFGFHFMDPLSIDFGDAAPDLNSSVDALSNFVWRICFGSYWIDWFAG